MIEKSLRELIQQLFLMCYMLNNEYISSLHFKTPHKEPWYHFAVKKLSAFLRGITSTHVQDFYCFYWSCSGFLLFLLVYICLEQKTSSHEFLESHQKPCEIFVLIKFLLKALRY